MLLMRCLPHLKESPLGGQEQLGKRKNLVNDQEEFASAAWGSRVCRLNSFQSKENSNKSFEVTFVNKFLCLYAYYSVILIDMFFSFFIYEFCTLLKNKHFFLLLVVRLKCNSVSVVALTCHSPKPDFQIWNIRSFNSWYMMNWYMKGHHINSWGKVGKGEDMWPCEESREGRIR